MNLNFKSEPERRVYDFLNGLGLEVMYEQPFIVDLPYDNGESKQRIIYPDFYLPQFGIIIEVFGMQNDTTYAKSSDRKKQAFKKAGLVCIPLHGLQDNWEDYLLRNIRSTCLSRMYAYVKMVDSKEANEILKELRKAC